jgi:putative membrane protein
MMGFGFGMGGVIMILVMVVIIALVVGTGILLLAALFPRAAGSNTMSGSAQRAEPPLSVTEILKLRYARGEITKDQFEEMRRDVEA